MKESTSISKHSSPLKHILRQWSCGLLLILFYFLVKGGTKIRCKLFNNLFRGQKHWPKGENSNNSSYKLNSKETWQYMNHFMKVKMTSAKLKSWLRDAELVSSGLESGSMPIVQVVHTGQYHLLCTTILFILLSERGGKWGQKVSVRWWPLCVHCLQHTYMTCHLFASFESILYPCEWHDIHSELALATWELDKILCQKSKIYCDWIFRLNWIPWIIFAVGTYI